MSEENDRPAPQQAGEWVPPPQHFAPRVRATARVPMAVVAPAPSLHRAAAPGRLRTLLVGGVVVGVLGAVGVAVTSGEEKRPAPLFVALPSLSATPAQPGGTAGPVDPTDDYVPLPTSKVRETVPGTGVTAGPGKGSGSGAGSSGASPSSSASPAPAAVVLPVVGAVLGLEPLGEPTRRLRHRDFFARIDAVGPRSQERDRADTRFTARAGRGDATCLSFEAVNYPGYFLRFRDSAVRLERPGFDWAFDADETFCALPMTTGGFVLRGRSQPNKYVTESNSWLSLNAVAADKAKAFVTRPPL